MKQRIKYINAEPMDTARPADRPAKSNKKITLIKKSLKVIQLFSPKIAARIIWYFSTIPGKARINESQQALLDQAVVTQLTYQGNTIYAYKWGTDGPKVLLAHGWRSKTSDFKKIIESLLKAGYVVEGIDMKAHGQSDGERTALPEFRDILKKYYQDNSPFHAIIGYSMGGIAAGVMLEEIDHSIWPIKLFLIAAPSNVRYFFKNTLDEVGGNDHVYKCLCDMVEDKYCTSIDHFDLREKGNLFTGVETHLIYDETDLVVPFDNGADLQDKIADPYFVHTRGIGHYKIIVYSEIINYLIKNMTTKERVSVKEF